MSSSPIIHILMATHQGQAHLAEQLESIAQQTHAHWTLTVSDDGSLDGTLSIARSFARRMRQRVTLLRGPKEGATRNFFHLINAARYESPTDLFAFCDQDDVWLPEKLSAAALRIGQQCSSQRPYLYCSRTRIVGETLEPRGLSPAPRRGLGFGNALLQNVASGNTMVFNAALLHILRRIQPEHSVLHDWSAYQAATGCGGVVDYDAEPRVLYRQHGSNVIGANDSPVARLRRVVMMLQGVHKEWNDRTEAAMTDIKDLLSDASLGQLNAFRRMRRAPTGLQRLRAGWKSGLWRQTAAGHVAFLFGLYFSVW